MSSAGQQEKTAADANSTHHNREGQNILFLDCSASYARSPYAGVGDDNIYTALPNKYTGRPDGTTGVLRVKTQRPDDTVLVPVQESILSRWHRKP